VLPHNIEIVDHCDVISSPVYRHTESCAFYLRQSGCLYVDWKETAQSTVDNWWFCSLSRLQIPVTANLQTYANYKEKNSRLIIFLSLCLTHRPVGEVGQPVSVRRQYEDTEASRVKARRSALLDSSGLYRQRAAPSSMSLEYSIKNAFITTISNISSGKPVSCYTVTRTLPLLTQYSLFILISTKLLTFLRMFGHTGRSKGKGNPATTPRRNHKKPSAKENSISYARKRYL